MVIVSAPSCSAMAIGPEVPRWPFNERSARWAATFSSCCPGFTTTTGIRSGARQCADPARRLGCGKRSSSWTAYQAVAPNRRGMAGSQRRQQLERLVIGTTPTYFDIRSWPVTEGALFTDSDLRSATRAWH